MKPDLNGSAGNPEASGGAKTYVLPAILTVVTIVASALIFKNVQLSIIAGFGVAALSMLYELRQFIERGNLAAEQSSSASFGRLLTMLHVHNEYYNDSWLYGVLSHIVQLRQQSKSHAHGHREFQRSVEVGLINAQKIVAGEKLFLSRKDELSRMVRLSTAMDVATKRVLAVTYDVHGYFDNFWRPIFGPPYIQSNANAIARGVVIKRIFIVSKSVIADPQSEKRAKLNDVLCEFQKLDPTKMTVLVALTEEVFRQESSDTSFLVSDDYFATESFTVVDGHDQDGYVCYGNPSAPNELTDRFQRLELLAAAPEAFGLGCRATSALPTTNREAKAS
jgi:hypothetical protein